LGIKVGYNIRMPNKPAELASARQSVIDAVQKVNKAKREQKLLGDWSLKDLIAHLTGWADYQLKVLTAVKTGQTPPEWGKIDGFNHASTLQRKKLDWEMVFSEFQEVSQKLVDAYEKVADAGWDKPLWKGKKTTLSKIIDIETRHYSKTHLPQILKLLDD